MLDHIAIEDVLFLDIETVPGTADYASLSDELQPLWDKKAAYFLEEGQSPADVYGRAGIYAEFGKIICISVGFVHLKDGQRFFRTKSFAGDNEKVVLEAFGAMLEKFTADPQKNICGHNAREFDFPFIARRMLINGLRLPAVLDVAGKKPWEVKFLDTMDLWKFGDYKHYTSLSLLTTVFGIPSPKDDIDGSQVAGVYYNEKDLNRIVKYCEKDVLATAQLFLRFKGEPLIEPDHVKHV